MSEQPQPGISCISPIDGRYAGVTRPLGDYFSEKALIRYRLLVEVEYFIALCQLPLEQLRRFPHDKFEALRDLYRNFSDADALVVKEIEKTTNHDIKALEYFLKQRMDQIAGSEFVEFIHFGLTSQDVNNTAIPLSLKLGIEEVILPSLEQLQEALKALSLAWKDIPMLARTHGQAASPTTAGKEMLVFLERIQRQSIQLRSAEYPGKFGGATGNFNAHMIAYPGIDWPGFADNFVGSLGLRRSQTTTQIDHYDGLAEIFDNLRRICVILIDLDRDCWQYIAMSYFHQKTLMGEVGSSAMPHKVNPIDFENSEGNAGLAISLLHHFSAKLPVSRLQRDLTDSTVLRNIGVPLGHMLIALKAAIKGLGKIEINQQAMEQDLQNNWVVVAEAIQTILRREGYPQPYEKLKDLTRNQEKVTRETMLRFIEGLQLPDAVKEELRQISPFNYTGYNPFG